MEFEPDILVTSREEARVALVVEAKVAIHNLDRAEEQLKLYMVAMQCPMGVLITPERMWIYRDSYSVRSSQSVQPVGQYSTDELWTGSPPRDQVSFEEFVQRWLEQLPEQAPTLPRDVREAITENLLPAVLGGEVRAAHPRR